eukprot:scaffold28464_cov20-Tisochrysis_lutea.AAC.1
MHPRMRPLPAHMPHSLHLALYACLQGAAMLFAGVGVYVTQPSHSGGITVLESLPTAVLAYRVLMYATLCCGIYFDLGGHGLPPSMHAHLHMLLTWILLLKDSLLQLEGVRLRGKGCCFVTCKVACTARGDSGGSLLGGL